MVLLLLEGSYDIISLFLLMLACVLQDHNIITSDAQMKSSHCVVHFIESYTARCSCAKSTKYHLKNLSRKDSNLRLTKNIYIAQLKALTVIG